MSYSEPAKSQRGDQLMRLRRLRLKHAEGVRASLLKCVLRCVDDHGAKCWASADTIAKETQLSVRSVMRAVPILVERGYLTEAKRVGQTTFLSINWSHPDLCQGVMGDDGLGPMPGSHPPMPGSHLPMSGSHPPMPGRHTKRKKRIETEKKRNASTPRYDADDYALAEKIFLGVQSVAPKTPPPKLEGWANTIRLMRNVDGHTLDEIAAVFRWANADEFWKTNILSAQSLRTKFARLHARMINPATQGKPRTAHVGAGVTFQPDKDLQW